MYLLSIDNIVSGKIVQALCWMLVHSLWIGMTLTVITGIIMLSTKRRTALLRYNLLVSAFMLFALAMAVVFAMQITAMSKGVNEAATTSAGAAIIYSHDNINALNSSDNKANVTAAITNFFNNYADIIVSVWVLIIAFRCISLISSLRKVKQLKSDQLLIVGEYWHERLIILSARLNIKVPVRFFQSGIAKIPMVVGHFKPVILFPVGILTSLAPEEVEAILIHELAHIRRKDYLVNMLQNFVEILFFFNPAILWISGLIKIERENCCDDIAVAQTSSKRNYINALVSFQEYHLNVSQYATTLAGTRKHLLQRVKRMLYNNNKTLNAMEKTFLTLCFIVATSLMVVFSQTKTTGSSDTNSSVVPTDTTLSISNRHYNTKDFKEGSTTTYSQEINDVAHTLKIYKRKGVLYEIYDDITSFKINGKIIPQSEWGKYEKLIGELRQGDQGEFNMAEQKEKLLAELDSKAALMDKQRVEQDTVAEQLDKLQAEQEKKAEELEKQAEKMDQEAQNMQQQQQRAAVAEQQMLLNKMKAEANSKKMLLEKKNAERNNKKMEQEKKKIEAEIKKIEQEEKKAEKQKEKGTSKIDYKRNQLLIADNAKDVINNRLKHSANSNGEIPPPPPPYYKPNPTYYKFTGIQSDGSTVDENVDVKMLTQNFIDDLTKEKVITTITDLSYQMCNESLIVNGKVQPEALHQKLKDKYIKSPDWKLLYNWASK